MADSTVPQFANPPLFPLGVWMPPATDFGKWKARWCNTMMYVPQGHDLNAWSWQSVLSGLWQVREPAADPITAPDAFKLDVLNTPNLLGIVFGDEPDLNKADPVAAAAKYAASKQLAPHADVWVNFSGGYVLGWQAGGPTDDQYREFIAAADVIGNDIYPVTGWGQPNNMQMVGQVLDKMKGWTNKPKYCFIELSNQNLSWVPNDRGPTAGEVVVQVWGAIVHGVLAIIYFPEQIGGGFQFDVTPTDVAAAVTATNMQVTQYADYLAEGSYSMLDTGNPLVHAATWTLPKGTLKVAVNWSSQQQQALNATFGPLEVKIQEVQTAQPAPLPPPDASQSVTVQRLAQAESNIAAVATWIRKTAKANEKIYPWLVKQGCPISLGKARPGAAAAND